MSKYAVVYWKNLKKDQINIKEFSDEAEMVEFAEEKKVSGYGILVAQISHNTISGEKVYEVRNYGAYVVFKHIAIYLGLILTLLGVFVFLYFKGKGI
jgi:hypothetical protein